MWDAHRTAQVSAAVVSTAAVGANIWLGLLIEKHDRPLITRIRLLKRDGEIWKDNGYPFVHKEVSKIRKDAKEYPNGEFVVFFCGEDYIRTSSDPSEEWNLNLYIIFALLGILICIGTVISLSRPPKPSVYVANLFTLAILLPLVIIYFMVKDGTSTAKFSTALYSVVGVYFLLSICFIPYVMWKLGS